METVFIHSLSPSAISFLFSPRMTCGFRSSRRWLCSSSTYPQNLITDRWTQLLSVHLCSNQPLEEGEWPGPWTVNGEVSRGRAGMGQVGNLCRTGASWLLGNAHPAVLLLFWWLLWLSLWWSSLAARPIGFGVPQGSAFPHLPLLNKGPSMCQTRCDTAENKTNSSTSQDLQPSEETSSSCSWWWQLCDGKGGRIMVACKGDLIPFSKDALSESVSSSNSLLNCILCIYHSLLDSSN